jgi:metal-responsive CopG/Arc/MetJ family transcriptional regulator
METKRITLTLPTNIYEELLEAKNEEEAHNVADFVRTAVVEKLARMRWQRNLEDLQREIREAGGLELRGSKEEVIERLRETRREIFETEYAHLYR